MRTAGVPPASLRDNDEVHPEGPRIVVPRSRLRDRAEPRPVFFDRSKTIDKACRRSARRVARSAQIIVFSEPGSRFCHFGQDCDHGSRPTQSTYGALLRRHADDQHTIRSGCATLRRTQRHRRDQGATRWTRGGDAHDLRRRCSSATTARCWAGAEVMPTFVSVRLELRRRLPTCSLEADYSRIGGLICGESLMTLARAHLIAQGEDFHVAVFPRVRASREPEAQGDPCDGPELLGLLSCACHAFEPAPSCSARAATSPTPTSQRLRLARQPRHRLRRRRQRGLRTDRRSPGTAHARDAIVYAVYPAQFVKIAKDVIDAVRRYARPIFFTLSVHTRPTSKSRDVRSSRSRRASCTDRRPARGRPRGARGRGQREASGIASPENRHGSASRRRRA